MVASRKEIGLENRAMVTVYRHQTLNGFAVPATATTAGPGVTQTVTYSDFVMNPPEPKPGAEPEAPKPPTDGGGAKDGGK